MNERVPADLAPQALDHTTALPARYYTDPSLPALERRAIFDRSWQLIAHACQLRRHEGPGLQPAHEIVDALRGLRP